jgi:glucose-1-phosphate cytidylyltransferase
MKVVLFCGGMGLRLRDYSEAIPKPMVPLGYRPILWHVMRYYAHFGHKEFILCLGWKADVIKQYFLNYDECLSNDFVFHGDKQEVTLLERDIHDWKITFVDTGIVSNIGQRLRAVRHYVDKDEFFLANYADGLTDLHLPDLIDFAQSRRAVATMLCVQPRQPLHTVALTSAGLVSSVAPLRNSGVWINGGYFVLRNEIFDYLHDGEELVEEPFQRLLAAERLAGMRHDGFWSCMDTYKDKQALDELCAHGDAPWEVWKHSAQLDGNTGAARTSASKPSKGGRRHA